MSNLICSCFGTYGQSQGLLYKHLRDSLIKLDWVGPLDNRPSTDKLHHFVKKKIIIVICDM